MNNRHSPNFYFNRYIQEGITFHQWTPGTIKSIKSTQKHLACAKTFTHMDDFDENGLNSFIYYLRAKCMLMETTVRKHFLNLKSFLSWALRNSYCNNTCIKTFRPRFKTLKNPVIFLTRDEIMKLYRYRIPKNGTVLTLPDIMGARSEFTVSSAGGLAKARDMFCFCAFTSLRYSDMIQLKHSDIQDSCIQLITQKTNDSLCIDLNPYSNEIIQRYSHLQKDDNRLFPAISNQKMNLYLKTLGRMCGFNSPVTRTFFHNGKKKTVTSPKWALLSTHAARKTFICNMLAAGIPPQTIMKWTGHSDYKSMKPYIDISSSDKAEAMKLFSKRLSCYAPPPEEE